MVEAWCHDLSHESGNGTCSTPLYFSCHLLSSLKCGQIFYHLHTRQLKETSSERSKAGWMERTSELSNAGFTNSNSHSCIPQIKGKKTEVNEQMKSFLELRCPWSAYECFPTEKWLLLHGELCQCMSINGNARFMFTEAGKNGLKTGLENISRKVHRAICSLIRTLLLGCSQNLYSLWRKSTLSLHFYFLLPIQY